MKSLFKKYRVAFVILLICGGVIFFNNEKTYGNTEAEIMKAIYEMNKIDSAQEDVKVIEVIDMGTTRVAGFCTSLGKTGIIEFEKDKKGQYVYACGEIYQEEIRNYIQCFKNVYPEKATKPNEKNKDAVTKDESSQLVYIVIGNSNEKYDVTLNVNKAFDFNGEIPQGKPTMLTFKMPELQDSNSYNFDLRVIDSRGNNILKHS